jgi:UDP-N-acetylglucosamine/UDP-N-acetylgalactosamine diphosphorylase
MIKSTNNNWQKYIDQVYQAGQEHIFRFWDELTDSGRKNLIKQISEIDFDLLNEQTNQALKNTGSLVTDHKLEPADFITLKERESQDEAAQKIGELALRNGKIAAFLVAGGQGTRLGFDGPKGKYPVTPVKKKSLFQLHAEKLLAIGKKHSKMVPWYIMTSQTNYQQTADFFKEKDYFGYEPNDVFFLIQEMIPAIDRQGKLILDAKDHIFMNPNGHGGSLKALWKSGAIADMKQRGVDTIFYFQVDNVLNPLCDPAYLGYHIREKSEMSNKVVRKKYAGEKMGVLCKIDGKLGLVEYSDFDEELKNATYPDGSLQFWAGNIATHIFSLSFIERENQDGFKLPYHIAEKSIPYIDDNGNLIKSDIKNGIKFESFVFDALQDVNKSVSIELRREEEFSPLKNNEGENSPQTVHDDLNNTWAKWLEQAGFDLGRDKEGKLTCNVEISPLFALTADDVLQKKDQIRIPEGDIYLE